MKRRHDSAAAKQYPDCAATFFGLVRRQLFTALSFGKGGATGTGDILRGFFRRFLSGVTECRAVFSFGNYLDGGHVGRVGHHNNVNAWLGLYAYMK